ncbi:MAG: ribonuclease HII [Fusobacteriaceae bacterium]
MKTNENKLYCFDRENGDIIGVDEAGRGPLAGCVVAGAVYLKKYTEKLNEINDSKKLSELKREKLFDIIKEHFEVGIGIATEKEIDEINILNATFLAMRRALEELEKKNICISEKKILVDGNHNIREYNGNQQFVIKGDSKSLSIAAASIIAKVFRDRYMKEMSKEYPDYEFEKHKGYGTKRHREILIEKGPIEIHRKTFLKKILGV